MAKPIASTAISESENDHLEALAMKLGVRKSDVIRAFIAKGLQSNPVTAEDLRRAYAPPAPKAAQREPVIEVLDSGALQPLRSGDSDRDGGETGIRTRRARTRQKRSGARRTSAIANARTLDLKRSSRTSVVSLSL